MNKFQIMETELVTQNMVLEEQISGLNRKVVDGKIEPEIQKVVTKNQFGGNKLFFQREGDQLIKIRKKMLKANPDYAQKLKQEETKMDALIRR